MKVCLLPGTEEFVGNDHFSALREQGPGALKIPTEISVGIVRFVH